MSRLPHIDEVLDHVRSAVSEQEKTAADETEAPKEFASKIASGLHKCAEVLKTRADAPVTYDEVFSLGRQILEQD
jgi:hypothetical protein